MAKNNLTPEQDLITRAFFEKVAEAPNVFSNDKAYKRQLVAMLCSLLNYDRLADGRFITKGTPLKFGYGKDLALADYPDEWEADAAAAEKAFYKGDDEDETYNDTDTVEADNSESGTDTEVRQAVLPEDV